MLNNLFFFRRQVETCVETSIIVNYQGFFLHHYPHGYSKMTLGGQKLTYQYLE